MSGLEAIVGLEKLTIQQCQRLAEKAGFDSATFDLCGPKGKLKAKWLDAYMGMFQVEGSDGFMMTRQLEFNPDVWCENLQFGRDAAGGSREDK
jgi:hypothetical protein